MHIKWMKIYQKSSERGESDDPKLAKIGIGDEGTNEGGEIGNSRPNVD